MSLWRAKKRYEANQDLNELADSTVLAITLLRNDPEEFSVYSEDQVEEFLRNGVQILDELQTSIESPETVEDYYIALADHLRKTGQKQTAQRFAEELQILRTTLHETSEDLEWRTELNHVEKLFRRIEDFTSETSARNLDNVKSHLAVGNR